MPFVSERHFILATRETGYRTTSSAVAELIDNALQAGARSIRILTRVTVDNNESTIEVAVLDNGRGMTRDGLMRALRFGGTDRFDDRGGLGRFGMGLPNSSVSQARRVDVFSWTKSKQVLHVYLDVDEVAEGELTDVAEPTNGPLPSWLGGRVSPHGTAVVWSRCDRIPVARFEAFKVKLSRSIGQVFRYFIWDGVEIWIDDMKIAAVDPLACLVDGKGAMPIGQPLVYEIRSPRDSAKSSKVEVRFSLLPVADWSELPSEEKRARGISKGAGVSVVRAGREIAYGWYLIGQKRKENYDDWWRCEIRFEPELDELFGVTHSKQGVRPSPDLETVLSQDLERIAHDLNRRVRTEFTRLKTGPESAATVASKKDRVLPPLRKPVQASVSKNGGIDYHIKTKALPAGELFQSSMAKGSVTVTINEKHPFYSLYAKGSKGQTGEVRFAVESLLLAMARAAQSARKAEQKIVLRQFVLDLSANLSAFLRK